MSSPATQPCAPPLNLVPNGTTGSAFPPPLDPSDIPSSDSNPGFGDLVNQALAGVADPSDGFDQVVTDTVGLIDELDSVLAAGDTDLDAVLSLLAAADTSNSDAALTDYTNSFADGQSIVSSAQALSVPDLLTLPISSLPAGGPGPAPALVTLDFGTVHVGSKIPGYRIGSALQTGDYYQGINGVFLVNGDPTIFTIFADYHESVSGAYTHYTWDLIVLPHKVGTFTGQLEWNISGGPQPEILTVKITVIP